MKTLQETFDRVVAHARKQPRKAVAEVQVFGSEGTINKCVFRAPNGDQCFAGCLIPDDQYKPEMELEAVHEGSMVGKILMAEGHDMTLVRTLMLAHDKLPADKWEEAFKIVADSYKLAHMPA